MDWRSYELVFSPCQRRGHPHPRSRHILFDFALSGLSMVCDDRHTERGRVRRGADGLVVRLRDIAQITKNPEKPLHELLIAIAGPLVNVVIAVLLLAGLGFTVTPRLLTGDDGRSGRPSGDMWEVGLWEDGQTVVGNELFYNYQAYNQAIVVPETIDAIRPLTGIEKDGMASIAKTDAALGLVREFLTPKPPLA